MNCIWPSIAHIDGHWEYFSSYACTRCCCLQHADGRDKDIPEEDDDDGINEASSRLSLFAAVEGDGASSCRPLVPLLVSSRQTIGNSCFDSVTQVS